jgi:hypothetical protein
MPRYGLFVMRFRGPAVMVLHGLRQSAVPFCNWSRIRDPKTNNRPFHVRVVEGPSTPLPSDPPG